MTLEAFGVRVGDRIELISMDDKYAVAPGSLGWVYSICDVPGVEQIGVAWDNGRGLNIVPGIDKFKVVGHSDDYTHEIFGNRRSDTTTETN